jgi:hypothetical protein
MQLQPQAWRPLLALQSRRLRLRRASPARIPRRRLLQLFNTLLESSTFSIPSYPPLTCQAFQPSPESGTMNPEWYVYLLIHYNPPTFPKVYADSTFFWTESQIHCRL